MASAIWWIFEKKRPANFNFIWLEWNSYDSSIQIYIVWSRSSIFKLKSSPAQGWSWIDLGRVVFVESQSSMTKLILRGALRVLEWSPGLRRIRNVMSEKKFGLNFETRGLEGWGSILMHLHLHMEICEKIWRSNFDSQHRLQYVQGHWN